ncbi:hypothetical protein SAMN05518863_103146 [Candidatus Pantoea symbiotica]|uniref:Uncharacterized protein n=1 Tax=Candidatus Pantoea symbiotica TaxID=1884370 RepID=A0A1I3UX50_9GAMM|nr:hypothetical protein SAMN05518863_103146 [Pantoea symbiotica]SFU61042.1 hypothetical protein SAMN05518864_103146 [Pantoea sp. YR525]
MPFSSWVKIRRDSKVVCAALPTQKARSFTLGKDKKPAEAGLCASLSSGR